MGVIRAVDAGASAQRAMPLHLGDLAREGDQLQARARAEAQAIVEQAQRERQGLIDGAAERGFEEGRATGHAEGLEAGRAEGRAEALSQVGADAERLVQRWSEALDRFEADRASLLQATRDDLVRLAALVAERVTKRAIELDPSLVVDQAEAVLALVARPTRMTLLTHPEDAALVRASLPGLLERFVSVQHAEMLEDESLPRGSCVARTSDGGVIDASVQTQIDRIIEELLPDGSRDSA